MRHGIAAIVLDILDWDQVARTAQTGRSCQTRLMATSSPNKTLVRSAAFDTKGGDPPFAARRTKVCSAGLS